jgi:hypothetical protein
MSTLVENKWNPITLKGGKIDSPVNITSHVVSSSWYNKVINNDGSRLQRLKNFYDADKCSVEISRALDIIAEDISASNAADVDLRHFFIDYGDKKTKKTTISLVDDALKMWEHRTAMDVEFYDRVRRTLLFGAKFYRKNEDGSLSELPTERFVGYILDEHDENLVTHYLYDPTIERVDRVGRIFKSGNVTGVKVVGQNNDRYETISSDDMIIFKIGNKPFGESLLERVYSLWKTMKLLEDAIVIYRVTRSFERRVYYIDVGNLQGAKREQAIERIRLRLSQKKVNRGGDLTTEYDPQSMGEDIFIPTSSTGKGSRVEQLQAGMSLGELSDLDWFSKKLAAGLRIPQTMLDTPETNQTQYSDMRVGQMYAVEMRYLGMINRYRKRFRVPLAENFTEFCTKRDITLPQYAEFKIQEAHSFAKYKQMELDQSSLNIMNSTLQLTALSKKYALGKYLSMDQEALRMNEEAVLCEKGIAADVVKTMLPSEIDNIVYGDGRLGEKYGIVAQQMGY